jgi:hypothetical protein
MDKYKKNLIIITSIVIIIIIVGYFVITNYNSKKIETISTTEEVTVENPITTDCSNENVLLQFNEHMKFNYPDWKIKGDPIIKEISNDISSCTYQVRFESINPHLKDVGITEKDIIIVQIYLSGTQYSFKTVRGVLY